MTAGVAASSPAGGNGHGAPASGDDDCHEEEPRPAARSRGVRRAPDEAPKGHGCRITMNGREARRGTGDTRVMSRRDGSLLDLRVIRTSMTQPRPQLDPVAVLEPHATRVARGISSISSLARSTACRCAALVEREVIRAPCRACSMCAWARDTCPRWRRTRRGSCARSCRSCSSTFSSRPRLVRASANQPMLLLAGASTNHEQADRPRRRLSRDGDARRGGGGTPPVIAWMRNILSPQSADGEATPADLDHKIHRRLESLRAQALAECARAGQPCMSARAAGRSALGTRNTTVI